MPPRIVLITGASSGIGLATARALAAQGDEIIMNLASERYARRLDFDNLSGEKSYSLRSAYERSKLEVVIFSNELARRLAGTAVTANSVGPGPARTRLGDDLRGAAGPATNVVKSLRRFQQADKAAATVVELASSPNLRGVSGRFFVRRHEQRTRPITHDTRSAGRLWDASELLTMRLPEPKPPPPAPKDHR